MLPRDISLYILLTAFLGICNSCQKRIWDNPFDPDCPKEIYTPNNLKASQVEDEIHLTWSQTNQNISGFVIELQIGNGHYISIWHPSNTETSYTYKIDRYNAGKLHNFKIYSFADKNASKELTASLTPLFLPTLNTKEVAYITSSTAISGGIISSDGGSQIIARGIVYDTSQNPTLEKNKGKTIHGGNTGEFTSSISGLGEGTIYYVRAYATNASGTIYGNELSFRTKINYPNYLPEAGLLLWLPFDGNASDKSTYANNVTVHGAVLTTDRFGTPNKAYFFNGASYLYLGNNSLLTPKNFTISLWFKADTLGKDVNVMIRARWYGYSVHLLNNGILHFQSYQAGDAKTDIYSSKPLNDKQWHHIVASFSSATSKLYVDGILISSANARYDNLTALLGGIAIGRDGDAEGWLFHGSIDDVGFWNRGLSEQEILNLFNGSD